MANRLVILRILILLETAPLLSFQMEDNILQQLQVMLSMFLNSIQEKTHQA